MACEGEIERARLMVMENDVDKFRAVRYESEEREQQRKNF